MELWVRSQNKEKLGKVCLIEYSKDDYGYHLFGWHDKFDGHSLGTYKSKERALEILDEIQDILLIKNIFSLNDEIIIKSFKKNTEEEIKEVIKQISVYQMPEE